jgi:hypothetical protein
VPVGFLDSGELDGGSVRWQRLVELSPGWLKPRTLGRAERTTQLVEELRWLAVHPGPEQFDPDRGASGRPKASYEIRAGAPGPGGPHTRIKAALGGQTCLAWVDGKLVVTGHNGGRHRFSCADFAGPARSAASARPGGSAGQGGSAGPGAPVAAESAGRRREVAEVVWFESKPPRYAYGARKVSLHLLDARGYCLLTLTPVHFAWSAVAKVARAAGVPATGYSIRSGSAPAERIRKLLFPPGKRHKAVHG